MTTARSEINRRLGYPRVKVKWLRNLAYRRFLDWYRASRFCQSIGSGMVTPLESMFRQLELLHLLPKPLIALEVFGGTGLFKTIDLAPRCEHITHLEISEALIHHAKKVLPTEKTAFLNEDSIEAVRKGTLHRRDYNLIHIDNSPGCFGPGYCENFDLFPQVLDYMADEGVLVFNVWLDIGDMDPGSAWLSRRKAFFGLGEGDDPRCIEYELAKRAYLSKIPEDRFVLRDSFAVTHYGKTIYLVIALRRRGVAS